ncbi:enoyl-CoA hydratase [Sulfolobales archaeon HS-7]|nr:enoyl-CoA hydratase [Sulfolobales archaeon HS-7]
METIELEERGKITIIYLNRPEKRNAINIKMAEEIASVLTELNDNSNVRVVIITGKGGSFSAGADVKEMYETQVEEIVRKGHMPLWNALRRFRKPVIAVINGVAAGGGLELAMACDIIIAEKGTKLGQPEINLGIIPGAGGTQRLTRTIGKYKAMKLVLTGELITAEEAERMGLITALTEPGKGLEEAIKLAQEITKRPSFAVELAKESVSKATETNLEQGLDIERRNFYLTLTTDEGKEGMKAFIEKRKPSWMK